MGCWREDGWTAVDYVGDSKTKGKGQMKGEGVYNHSQHGRTEVQGRADGSQC